ncbi:hypothetical protein FB451DRAFT_1418346 [Mycena latifolia]|nr:hypothetical protein FB451DRAFT_1418346 [Mycena latifolia]
MPSSLAAPRATRKSRDCIRIRTCASSPRRMRVRVRTEANPPPPLPILVFSCPSLVFPFAGSSAGARSRAKPLSPEPKNPQPSQPSGCPHAAELFAPGLTAS